MAVPGTLVSSLTGKCISCSEPKKRILADLGLNPTSILNSSGNQAADLPLPPAAPQTIMNNGLSRILKVNHSTACAQSVGSLLTSLGFLLEVATMNISEILFSQLFSWL